MTTRAPCRGQSAIPAASSAVWAACVPALLLGTGSLLVNANFSLQLGSKGVPLGALGACTECAHAWSSCGRLKQHAVLCLTYRCTDIRACSPLRILPLLLLTPCQALSRVVCLVQSREGKQGIF